MNFIGTSYLISPRKSSRKSAVLMRLPDDVLNLLEHHALNQRASSKLTLKFDGSTGIIKIPNEGNNLNFSFNVLDYSTARDSTYCVQENEDRTLETVALMQQKINIKPGASIFEKTRSKMTNQRKTSSCKTIEMMNSPTGSRSKKLTVKPPRAITTTSNSTSLNGNITKKYIPYQGFDIVSQPLRKRIIHKLALKPYKKSELFDELKKEGISEIEKIKYSKTLFTVSSVKDGVYSLEHDKWIEVEDDWRFYSPEDAATVQKNRHDCHLKTNQALNNQPDNAVSKKRSLVEEIIANSSFPAQKKQKKNDKEKTLAIPLIAQYALNPSTKDQLIPGSGSKCADYQPLSANKKGKKKKKNKKDVKKSSSKKNEEKKKKKKRKKSKRKNRKKKEHFVESKIGIVDSEITITDKKDKIFPPKDSSKMKKITSPPGVSSTVKEHFAKYTIAANGQMNNSSCVFLTEDSAHLKKITSPPAVPTSTVDDMTLDANTYLNDSSSVLSFTGNSSFVEETKVQVMTDKKSNHSSRIFGHPTLSHAEFENFNCLNLKPEQAIKEDIFPSSVMESAELFNKPKEFVSVNCLNNIDPQVPRTLENSSSQSTSKMTYDNQQGVKSIDRNTYDFKRQFTKISSFEQRAQYKEYFNSEYHVYLNLHKRLLKADEKLKRLEENLKTLKEGTHEHKAALIETARVYKMYLHDSQYNEFCRSRAFLHEKLSHIRCLILEFDNEQFRSMIM